MLVDQANRLPHELVEYADQIKSAAEIVLFKVDKDRSAKLYIPVGQLDLLGVDRKNPWVFCKVEIDGSVIISKATARGQGIELKYCEHETIVPVYVLRLYAKSDKNVDLLPAGKTCYPVQHKDGKLTTDGRLFVNVPFKMDEIASLKRAAARNNMAESLFIRKAIIQAINAAHNQDGTAYIGTHQAVEASRDERSNTLVSVKTWSYEEISSQWTKLFNQLQTGLQTYNVINNAVPYEGIPFNGRKLFISFKPGSEYMLDVARDNQYIVALEAFVHKHFGEHVEISACMKGDLNNEAINETSATESAPVVERRGVKKIDGKQLVVSTDNTKLWSIFSDTELFTNLGFTLGDRLTVKRDGNKLVVSKVSGGNDKNSRALHKTSENRASFKFPKDSQWDSEFAGVEGKANYFALLDGENLVIYLNDAEFNDVTDAVPATEPAQAGFIIDEFAFYATPELIALTGIDTDNAETAESTKEAAVEDTIAPVFTVTKAADRLNIYAERDVWLKVGFGRGDRLSFVTDSNSLSLVHMESGAKKNSEVNSALTISGEKFMMSFMFTRNADETRTDTMFNHITPGSYLAQCIEGKIAINLNAPTSKPRRIIRNPKDGAADQAQFDLNQHPVAVEPAVTEHAVAAPVEAPVIEFTPVVHDVTTSDVNVEVKTAAKPAEILQQADEATIGLIERKLEEVDPLNLLSRMNGLVMIYETMCPPSKVEGTLKALFSNRNALSEEEVLYAYLRKVLESRPAH